jgi:hypothetical protein
MKHVTREVTVPFPPDRAVAELTASLSRMKCRLELQTGNSLTFSRRYSPAFFIVLYVILFPIGLLLILARPKHATSMNCQKSVEALGSELVPTTLLSRAFSTRSLSARPRRRQHLTAARRPHQVPARGPKVRTEMQGGDNPDPGAYDSMNTGHPSPWAQRRGRVL